MARLFFRTLRDEAAVGGEGVGAGEEAEIGTVVVDHDKVVAVAKLEFVDHVGEGVAGVDYVLVVEGHHQFITPSEPPTGHVFNVSPSMSTFLERCT